jgi:hypothetical protein
VHQPVVRDQRLRDVALGREGPHEQRVRRLAVGRTLDEPARRALRRGRITVVQGGSPLELACMPAELLELEPPLVDPRPAAARQELVLEDVGGRTRVSARRLEALLLQGQLGALDQPRRHLDVDPYVVWEHELQLPPALEAVGAQHPAHARQDGAQPRVARRRRIVSPQSLGERGAADPMPSMVDEAGEDDPGLATREAALQALAGLVDGEAAAQPDPEASRRAGGRNHHGKGDRTPV